jgi:hypothetical protein
MATRILVELALFLTPFAIFFFYRLTSRELRVRDRWPLTTLVVAGAGLAVAALIIGPLLTPSDKGKCYQAARYENGVTTPAKMVPCEEVTVPEQEGEEAPPAETPVAPRDQTLPPRPQNLPETPPADPLAPAPNQL